MRCVVVIPSRLGSSRLPGKPLLPIGDAPMIVQVWRRAMEAQVGPVVVAAAEPEIAEAVRAAGGEAVMTDPDHPSGSDRVQEAVNAFDKAGAYDGVINCQGDLPTLEPRLIAMLAERLAQTEADIVTLACEITDEEEKRDPNVVKPVVSFPADGAPVWGRGLYFTRATAPAGDGPLYHHIGLYGFRRGSLARFVKLPPSPLELREKLEQLRALEAGMTIDVGVVDSVPVGVDTPADLERARAVLGVSSTE